MVAGTTSTGRRHISNTLTDIWPRMVAVGIAGVELRDAKGEEGHRQVVWIKVTVERIYGNGFCLR